jgi:hypothetical protein
MGHKVQPNQTVTILTVLIAVPSTAPHAAVLDEISDKLGEQGSEDPDSNILDWQYLFNARQVTAPGDVEEGDVFLERTKKYLGHSYFNSP